MSPSVAPCAPNTCCSTTARPWRHSKTSYSTCPVAAGLLQCHAGRSSSFPLASFQRVLHAAACTVLDLKPRDRVTPALRELHWLPVTDGFQYKLCYWFSSLFCDTCQDISQTFWHRLPIFQVYLHCMLHHVATSSCRGQVDELATEPFLLLHCEHGTGHRRIWNCCNQGTHFIVI